MDFIALHINGKEVLVNTKWIEMLFETSAGHCQIYACDQGSFVVEETYEEVKSMIWRLYK